jgi:hypothetical protein
MSHPKVQFYRSPLGERVTLEGKTCNDCCRFCEHLVKSDGQPKAVGRCGVTRGPTTRQHTACILFSLVNGWQLIESSSSAPSNEPPAPDK